jgi:hypothetical protein
MYKVASANAQRRVSAVLPKHMPSSPINIPPRDELSSLKRAVKSLEERFQQKDYQSKQEYAELVERKTELIDRIRELKKLLSISGVSPLDPSAVGCAFTDIARSRLPRYLFDEIMNEAKRRVHEAVEKMSEHEDQPTQ